MQEGSVSCILAVRGSLSEFVDPYREKVRIGDDCPPCARVSFFRSKRPRQGSGPTTELTGGIADEASECAHPACGGVDDLGVGEDVGQGDAADEEARGEEVAKVDGSGRVIGAKVVCAGAAPAEPVGERRKREQERYRRVGVGSAPDWQRGGRGEGDGD